MSVQAILKTIGHGIERESPSILVGLGITGLATTVILAVRATPKALYLIQEEEAARYADESKREPITKLRHSQAHLEVLYSSNTSWCWYRCVFCWSAFHQFAPECRISQVYIRYLRRL